MLSSPLLARLSKSIKNIPHGSRLVEVGAMAVILVVAGFGTNLITIGNSQDASAQEGQEEITTHYDTGLILCSDDNTLQQCNVPFRVTIETASVLKVGITVSPEHCSSTNYYVSVDGDEDTFGGTFIGRAGYSAIGEDSRTIPPYDFGTVESGSHTLDIWVEGIPGGCNQGYLSAWSGTLTVITSEPPEADTMPPVLAVPDDMTVDATTANGGTVVTYSVTAEDNADGTAILEEDGTTTQDDDGGDITISCEPSSGSEFPVGETVVECTATDAADNSDTASFMVTVNPPPPPPPDTTAPIIVVPEDMTVEATGPDGAQVTFEEEPSATDDVDGPVDVTCDYSSGDTFPIGGTVVTCIAEDAAGNTGEETFTVTVQDTTDPDVEITQATDRRNRVLAEGDTTPTPYIRITFEATDAVGVEDTECSLDGQAFTSCISSVVYDRLSRGTHQVTVRAADEAGNTGEDRFLFTIGSPSSSAAAAPGRQ